jgi:potassium-transporting ATPase potassium-binding subunit
MLMFLQFVTAATGMAAAVLVFNSMQEKQSTEIGNFYRYFVLSCTRILLPVSVLVAVILVFNGVPMTLEGKATITTLEGSEQQIARGLTAAMVAIKQLGTNGGGYFGVNSAHPLENPTYWTNTAEVMSIFLIPMAMIVALGDYLNRKKLAFMIFGVMTFGYVCLQIPAIYYEINGNPMLAKMGISQELGSMEGKEIRIGAAASAYWAVHTTVTSNGSVNAMHDSLMPLSGAMAMLGMMVNAFYGGVGVGFLNFYLYMIVAVFISGLMVGRTPEFLGRKIEASEIKIAVLITLLHPFLILLGTAVASYLMVQNPEYAWLNNSGFHGFSEMLFEYTSSAANNGSGFEGLGDNTPFWNLSTAIVLALGRYLPIIAPVAIAARLASKKCIPIGSGTLPTDNLAFAVMILAVIFIVAALSFFPALVLGPFAEHFTIY